MEKHKAQMFSISVTVLKLSDLQLCGMKREDVHQTSDLLKMSTERGDNCVLPFFTPHPNAGAQMCNQTQHMMHSL